MPNQKAANVEIEEESPSFKAQRSITVINESGSSILLAERVTPEEVGIKAFGLASLPSEWTKRFLVVTSDGFNTNGSNPKFQEWIVDFFGAFDVKVFVRSSGTAEDMQSRGQLESMVCDIAQVSDCIRTLEARRSADSGGTIHWVVQEHIEPQSKGHLSNERHLRRESRDWIAEFEVTEGLPPNPIRISIRQWRDGSDIDLDLACSSSFGISLVLKKVAKWALRYSPSRFHFEWVWDGARVWIVQGEVGTNIGGVNPRSILPKIIPQVKVAALQVFRASNDSDFATLGKLKNAKLYVDLGYAMPTFYRAESESFLTAVLAGTVPEKLRADLAILIQGPLIIRSDGEDIPEKKREMLPRSDELRTVEEAEEWLLTKFVEQIRTSKLEGNKITLIAHHFIPSVASAWARAEPSQRIVRIEALWGIPEGLYYFAHDTFEVDTMRVRLDQPVLGAKEKYNLRQRLRYKGSFIGPDEAGEWVAQVTATPFDWTRSVRRDDWLFEIAKTTRFIAEHCGFPVSVMWFIDNHASATSHRVLPWYHSKSDLAKAKAAAPRHKFSRGYSIEVATVDDWERLKSAVAQKEIVDRILLRPIDPKLIRNPDFTKELGNFANENKIVIELQGGILSHAFYLLQKTGANVECIDLYGADDEVIEFNKVVRDKIPEIIRQGGEQVEILHLAGDALVRALQKKLVEEAFEAMDAQSGEELVGELADVQEVIRAICQKLNVSNADLEQLRQDKSLKRGAFDKGLMLTRTSIQHSVHENSPEETPDLEVSAIKDVTELPSRHVYRRPDLIRVNQLPEKRLAFEIEVSDLGVDFKPLNFSLPIDGEEREFRLIVDLDRTASTVRGLVRLRVEPQQLVLDFDNE